jgi:hypothetical protein
MISGKVYKWFFDRQTGWIIFLGQRLDRPEAFFVGYTRINQTFRRLFRTSYKIAPRHGDRGPLVLDEIYKQSILEINKLKGRWVYGLFDLIKSKYRGKIIWPYNKCSKTDVHYPPVIYCGVFVVRCKLHGQMHSTLFTKTSETWKEGLITITLSSGINLLKVSRSKPDHCLFFTQNGDFVRAVLCRTRYCLVHYSRRQNYYRRVIPIPAPESKIQDIWDEWNQLVVVKLYQWFPRIWNASFGLHFPWDAIHNRFTIERIPLDFYIFPTRSLGTFFKIAKDGTQYQFKFREDKSRHERLFTHAIVSVPEQ